MALSANRSNFTASIEQLIPWDILCLIQQNRVFARFVSFKNDSAEPTMWTSSGSRENREDGESGGQKNEKKRKNKNICSPCYHGTDGLGCYRLCRHFDGDGQGYALSGDQPWIISVC